MTLESVLLKTTAFFKLLTAHKWHFKFSILHKPHFTLLIPVIFDQIQWGNHRLLRNLCASLTELDWNSVQPLWPYRMRDGDERIFQVNETECVQLRFMKEDL